MNIDLEALFNRFVAWWAVAPVETLIGWTIFWIIVIWMIRYIFRRDPAVPSGFNLKGVVKHTVSMEDLDGVTINVNHDGMPDIPDNFTITVKHEYPDDGKGKADDDDAEEVDRRDMTVPDMQKMHAIIGVHAAHMNDLIKADDPDNDAELFVNDAKDLRDQLTRFIRTHE